MKKIIFILLACLITMSFVAINDISDTNEVRIENLECKHRQCDAIAKSTGKRCKHCVSKSKDYQCWQHKPK
jgi:hypothetical protein